MADDLAGMLQASGHDIITADLLDDLASCGLKLKRLVPDDFGDDGVSIVSQAYWDLLRERAARR